MYHRIDCLARMNFGHSSLPYVDVRFFHAREIDVRTLFDRYILYYRKWQDVFAKFSGQ